MADSVEGIRSLLTELQRRTATIMSKVGDAAKTPRGRLPATPILMSLRGRRTGGGSNTMPQVHGQGSADYR